MQKEIDAQMNGILKGVNVYGNSTESADQFQPLIDFFANPTVGKYLQETGGIPPAIRGEVAKVFQDGYQTQVVPLLKEELDKMYMRQVRDAVGVKAGDVVEPTMEGGRFGFKLKAGVTPDPTVNGIVRTMNNSSFSKVLNKMIISDAHIQGTSDYNKSYETIGGALFGTTGEQKATTTDTQQKSSNDYVDPYVSAQPASLTLDDFDMSSLVSEASAEGMDTSTLEGDVKEVAKAIDIGESGGDYGALLGFTNRPGRKFDDVDITSKTINELLEFADGSGPYAAYSKKQVGRVATPMGRYQIVGSTLRNLKNKLGLTGEEQFTPEMQDKLFLALLKGRGYDKYKSGEMTKEEFLASVSKEWEGLSASRKSFNALVAAL
jgi:hypothetical protein